MYTKEGGPALFYIPRLYYTVATVSGGVSLINRNQFIYKMEK
jgi:hypothetical protein